MRIGVVGCGKMGLLHWSLLNTIPNTKVVAVCEKSPRITRFVKKMMVGKDTKVVQEIEELKDFNLDAVYVTTPIPTHHKIIKTIMSEGIARNVFCEKTLSSNKGESDQLSFWGKDKVCMVGYHKRFGVTYQRAKEMLDQGIIGDLTSFEACAFSSDFFSETKSGSNAPSARGGVLRDLGCHAIDLALWYFGDCHVINGKKETSVDEGEKFDVITSENIEGHFSASWSLPDYRMPYIGLSIRGKNGRLDVSDDKISLFANGTTNAKEWYRASLQDNVDFLLGGSEYYREDRHFIDCLSRGADPMTDFASGSKVDSIIQEVA